MAPDSATQPLELPTIKFPSALLKPAIAVRSPSSGCLAFNWVCTAEVTPSKYPISAVVKVPGTQSRRFSSAVLTVAPSNI